MAVRKNQTKLKTKTKIKPKTKTKKSESTGRVPAMADLLKQVAALDQSERVALQKQIVEWHKNMVQQHAKHQETMARIQFEGAGHLTKAMMPFVREEQQPEAIPGWRLRKEDWERTLKWAKTYQDLLRTLPEEFFLGYRDITDYIKLPAPIISIGPPKIDMGLEFTMIGYGFGYTQGRVEVYLGCLNQTLEAHILNWRPGAIHGYLENPSLAIPFNCPGTVRVVRGSDNAASESVATTLQPKHHVYLMQTASFSDSGISLDSYSKNIDFYSHVLPANYQLWNHPLADEPGCFLQLIAPQTILNDPATASIYAGPTVVVHPENHTRRLKVVVEIHDDYYYDFCIYVLFYILVPENFNVPDGWEALGGD